MALGYVERQGIILHIYGISLTILIGHSKRIAPPLTFWLLFLNPHRSEGRLKGSYGRDPR